MSLLELTKLKEINKKENRTLVVFDVGCNIDQSLLTDFTENFLNYCSDAKVIAIEPIHYEAYEKKYKTDNRITLIKIVLSYSSDNRIFFDTKIHGCPGLSSFVERSIFKDWGDGVRKTTVECTTVDNICQKFNLEKIDYLKIDTEGAELDVLKGSAKMMSERKINYIQFEFGGCAIEAGYGAEDIQNYLKKYGYFVVGRCGDDYLAVLEN